MTAPGTWPTPNPELADALIGSVLAAQGVIPHKAIEPTPWRVADFDRCVPWIASALKGQDDLTVDEIRDGVWGGWFQFWPADDGVMVSEVILSPRLRGLHVIAAGGTLRAIRELLPAVEAFARQAGANVGGATGRKGWIRYLRQFGYAPSKLTTVERAL